MSEKQEAAMRLALEALKVVWNEHPAIDALTAALEQPTTGIKQVIELYDSPEQPEQDSRYCLNCEALSKELAAIKTTQQEPVAYAVYHRMGGGKSLHWPEQHSPDGDASEYQLAPLYTSPPAQRTWVGLTDKEIDKGLLRSNHALQTAGAWRDGVEWATKQLREKNNG